MKCFAAIAALAALIGAPDALACRSSINPDAKHIREWNAKLAAARKVTGTYAVEREVPNPAQQDAVDELGTVVGPDGKVRAGTFVELANFIVVRCAGPIITKPKVGQAGTFYLQKRDADDRWLILHFERDAANDE